MLVKTTEESTVSLIQSPAALSCNKTQCTVLCLPILWVFTGAVFEVSFGHSDYKGMHHLWACVPEAFHGDLLPSWVGGFKRRGESENKKRESSPPPQLLLLLLAPPLLSQLLQVTLH